MTELRLKKTGKKLLRQASRDAITAYFAGLPVTDRRKKWLTKKNRYRLSCIQQYYLDTSAAPATTDHPAITAYVAASSPGHVIDGWSLLGRAVDALLRNDVYTAIHLSYYSELRAAMALLATEGVGILHDRHPIVEHTGTTSQLPKAEAWNPRMNGGLGGYQDRIPRTHAIVWPCLKHWVGLSKSFTLMNDLFKPANRNLSDWLSTLGSFVSANVLAKRWLSVWGLDIAIMDDDHESRNLASYRPSEFRLPKLPTLDHLLNYVSDLWRCFEPASHGTFPRLEGHLLKRAIKTGGIPLPIATGALATLGITGPEESAWLSLLNSPSEPLIFQEADKVSQIEDVGCHLQVIARAALLLNIATAASRRHLQRAGYTPSDLQFWWHRHGAERGLWDVADLVNPVDLWADINDCLNDIAVWQTNNPGNQSLNRWRRNSGAGIELLGAFEMVGIWGLMP